MVPKFRLHSLVDVVPWSALSTGEQQHVQQLTGRSAVPGILRPKPQHPATVKVVDHDTLTLLESFRDAAPFNGCDRIGVIPLFLRRFVMDGVLEVEVDGVFLSGPAAAPVVGQAESAPVPASRIAALSIDAVRYAASLPIDDPRILASRLYSFNSVPFQAPWAQAFADSDPVRELLGLGGSGPNRSVLEAGGYEEVDHAQWFAWTRTTIVTGGQRPELPFKLYLSPRPECLPDVFSRTIDVLVGCGAGSLKVGRTAQNLLRPDKLLIYVETHAALLTLAAELQRSLKGFAAQGVPFTCGVDADGLLSWGSDPPRLASFPGWTQAESWRSCIADRLAVGLLQARAQSCAEPWRFALEKLRLEGIDTCRWAPQGDGEYQPDASAGR